MAPTVRAAQPALASEAKKAPRSLVEAANRLVQSGIDGGPARAAFLARSMNALARLAPESDDRSLGDAAGERSDFGVLLRALQQPHALVVLATDDPLASARLRGLRHSQRLLEAEGGPLAVGAVASLLGISRQAVDKRRGAGRLLALPVGRRGYAYPSWQFQNGAALPGLDVVLNDLREHDPWMQLAFMLNGNTWLRGETPLDNLRRGEIDAVRGAAAMYGEQGGA